MKKDRSPAIIILMIVFLPVVVLWECIKRA